MNGAFARPGWTVPLLVALLATAVWTACFHFPGVWTATGIGERDKLFLDLQGSLAAGEARRAGLDPFQANPLDAYNRPHVYSEWWLVTGPLGLRRPDAAWLGYGLMAAFLVCALLVARPPGPREGFALLGVLGSPALLLAVNRANNDLVIFVLMSLALLALRMDRTRSRAVGMALLALAAVLKYFPFAAALLLVDARSRRERIGWIGLYGAVFLVAWPSLEPGLRSAARQSLHPEWLYAFGAPVIFRNLGLPPSPGFLLTAGGVLAGWAVYSALRAGRLAPPPPLPEPARAAEREAACGAALVLACFLLGSSYLYKMVFALWMLPWLWRAPPAGGEARWRAATVGLLYVVLWFEGLTALTVNLLITPLSRALAERALAVGLFAAQLAAWALATCLLRGLAVYAARRLPGLWRMS